MSETYVWLFKIIMAIIGCVGIYYAQKMATYIMEKNKTVIGYMIIFIIFLPYIKFISFLFEPIAITIPLFNFLSLFIGSLTIVWGIIEGMMRHYDVIA